MTFIYNVNGTEYYETEIFGTEWKKALAQAEREHTFITRTVINGEKIKYDFLTEGGCFLPMRVKGKVAMKVF